MLRIVSKADTAESFIQIFSHLCDRDSLFIVTRSPKAIGTETRFSVNLKTGEPLIKGQGTVTERFEDKQNPYGRMGMKLRFMELDDKSREFIERLVQAREEQAAQAAIPPDIALGTATTEPASSGPEPDPAKAETDSGEASASPDSSGDPGGNTRAATSEERARGSDFILPANPFGELTDNVLEAFIECSLYEDMTGISGQEGASEGESDGGGWGFFQPVQERASSPPAEQGGAQNLPIPSAPSPFSAPPPGANASPGPEQRLRTPPGMPAMPPSMVEPAMPSPSALVPGTPGAVPGTPGAVPGTPGAVPGTPGAVPGTPGAVTPPGLPAQPMVMPTGPMSFQNEPMPQAASTVQLGGYPVAGAHARRSNRNAIAIAVAVAVVVATLASLGVGYVLWGGSGKHNSGKQGVNETSTAPDPRLQDRAAEAGKGEGDTAAANQDDKGGKTKAEGDKAGADQGDKDGKAGTEGVQAGAKGDDEATAKADDEGDTAEQGTGDGAEADPGSEDSAGVAARVEGTECQVHINSKPEQAFVFAGDRKLGATPLDTTLPCGEVELRFTRPRRDPSVETVELAPDQVNKVDVDLKRPTVELVIKSSPSGAAVYFNGRYRGKAPVKLQVPGYRAAKIEVKKLGYRTLKKRVYPKGPSSTVTATLKKLGRSR